MSDRDAHYATTGLWPTLPPEEQALLEAHLRAQSDEDFDEVLDRLEIARLKRLPLRSLSAGQQRRVALARMLLSRVPLWLMDEPFTNLDRQGRKLVMDVTTEHLDRGGMCIMAAHQDVEIGGNVTKIVLQ